MASRASFTIRLPTTARIMAEDVRALLDHLGLGRADVMGYSMGARITAFLALAHPERVRSAVLGGLGIRLVDGVGLPETDRAGARSANACRCVRSHRLYVPGVRRADALGPARTCRLHARLAADAKPQRGRPHCGAGSGRRRQQGPGCGLGGAARGAHPRRAVSRPSRAATTCSRSATGRSRPACSEFLAQRA